MTYSPTRGVDRALFEPMTAPARLVAVLLHAGSARECWLVLDGGADGAASRAVAERFVSRSYALLLERVAVTGAAWPAADPPVPPTWALARGEHVALAPVQFSGMSLRIELAHHLARLLDSGAEPAAAEAAARASGARAVVARVAAVLHGETGAELEALEGTLGGALVAGRSAR